ncbi:sensor histidine kinase [Propioniciclava sp.]|uniref:sensor histidine kinase n=1 Tax=Propioniciclava sp. TaxID=2038686 RepID=UPI0026052B3F|nr:sensor histidine kinase [Propioniciclava sp.]
MSSTPSDAPPRTRPRRLGDDDLRAVRLVGLVVPVVFIGVVLAVRPVLYSLLGHETGFFVIGATIVLASAAFGWIMYRLIGRAHAEAVHHQEELAAERALRDLESQRHAAALTERDRIARELHDSVAQILGVAHLKLQVLGVHPEIRASEKLSGEVDALTQLCRDGYADVREAIMGLKDAHLPHPAILEHVDAYLERYSRLSGIPTRLDADCAGLALAPDAEAQVIRIIQEALSNVRKHAAASAATLEVRSSGDATTFTVADDGRGFDPDAVARSADAGYGLASMSERAAGFGGRLVVESAPGAGTRVQVVVPADLRLDEELSA